MMPAASTAASAILSHLLIRGGESIRSTRA
jgi:hypothetical protein